MNSIRSVLITGGTGTFGRAFAEHLLDWQACPTIRRVVIYSRGEHAQATMRKRFARDFDGDSRVRWMIGDVRDRNRLERAMAGVDTVVHAAALKRIEVGYYNPDELTKTNIFGAMNVIDAAFKMRVKQVVALSTDKAYQPVSPYGLSKALAESLFLNANNMFGIEGPKFSVCRYGNIFGAQGSVIPYWQELIANGCDQLPVSDPDCTRFLMLPGEAVSLVWNLLRNMNGGELAIPDWLPAYRVGDLVEAFDVGFKVNGLPAWEKLHESMNETLCSATARRVSVSELRHLIGKYPLVARYGVATGLSGS